MLGSVPAPVKKIFDLFPLRKFPASPSVLETKPATQYTLDFKSTPKQNMPNKWFNLIVYSLSPLEFDESYVIPLDPLCSSALLYLCYKHGFSLPHTRFRKDKPPTPTNTANVISVLSYHGSSDGELPVLIEDEKASLGVQQRALQRSIRTTFVIQEFINASSISPQETMLRELCDSTLYDCWVLTVLGELDVDEKLSIYCGKLVADNGNTTDFGGFTSIVHHDMVKSLLRRNGFHLRNKATFEHYSADYADWKMVNGLHKRRLSDESNAIRAKCRSALATLAECLAERGDLKFFFGTGGEPGAFDIKLAALVYAVIHVNEGENSFAEMLYGKPLLIEHSREVIEGCI